MREYRCISIPRMILENDGIECPIPLAKLSSQWPGRPDQTTQITSLLARRPLCARSGHLATDRLLYLCLSVRRLTPFFEVNPQFRRLGQPLNHRSGRHCPEAPSWSRAGEELRRVMTRLARGPRAPTKRGRPWTLAPRDR